MQEVLEVIIGTIMISLLGLISYKAGAFDKKGLIAGLVVSYLILISTGIPWVIIIFAFVILGSTFTFVGYNKKVKYSCNEFEVRRGYSNVLANGAVALFAAIAEGFTSIIGLDGWIFAVIYVGAIATATADTLATEIGLLSKKEPILITNFKKVKPGTSGGITLIGLVASILAALTISTLSYIFGIPEQSIKILIVISLAGFLGSIIDSLFGATIQRIGKCIICGKETEKLYHHDQKTIKVRGMEFMDNNSINLVSTAIGALIALLLFIIL
jgi:uncharacterized protein (TIGR00297 family)